MVHLIHHSKKLFVWKITSETISKFICKRIKNTGAKKLDGNTSVDAGLSLFGKEIFKNAFAKAGLTVLGNVIKNHLRVQE